MTVRESQPTVLLLGGSSGTGKTTLAERLGKRLGMSWFQADDLRLAFERSCVSLPTGTDDLFFFVAAPDVWRLAPDILCHHLIRIGELMTPAIEIIVANHVDTAARIVIEGDLILPSHLDAPLVSERTARGRVQALFLVEPDRDALLENMTSRARGIIDRSDASLRREAEVKWLHGQWLKMQAEQRGLPVIEVRPWETLEDRVLFALGSEYLESST